MSDGTFEDIPSSGYVVNGLPLTFGQRKLPSLQVWQVRQVQHLCCWTCYFTYNDYTTVSPSNWNELTYQDNNDTQIMNYISGSFFSFDFEFDSEEKSFLVVQSYHNAVTTLKTLQLICW